MWLFFMWLSIRRAHCFCLMVTARRFELVIGFFLSTCLLFSSTKSSCVYRASSFILCAFFFSFWVLVANCYRSAQTMQLPNPDVPLSFNWSDIYREPPLPSENRDSTDSFIYLFICLFSPILVSYYFCLRSAAVTESITRPVRCPYLLNNTISIENARFWWFFFI